MLFIDNGLLNYLINRDRWHFCRHALSVAIATWLKLKSEEVCLAPLIALGILYSKHTPAETFAGSVLDFRSVLHMFY